MVKNICVFCGSSNGANEIYGQVAQSLGQVLAERDITLVYGGGNTGLMGIVADAVMTHGGRVIGIIPQALAEKEVAHRTITELHIVASMHERKAMMADLADGFIAMPGGFGTIEEFCEILTWAQLGFHRKACGLLNVHGYYDGLLTFFDHAVQEKFVRSDHRRIVLTSPDPADLVTQLLAYIPTYTEKWLEEKDL